MSYIPNKGCKNHSLINQIVLTTAKIINEGLNVTIFNCEDISNQDFVEKAGYKNKYDNSYPLSQKEAMAKTEEILSDIYIVLESYCKNNILLNINLAKQISLEYVYAIYGNHLPNEMTQQYLVSIQKKTIGSIVRHLPIPVIYDKDIITPDSDIDTTFSMKVANFAIRYIDKMTSKLIMYCCYTIENIIRNPDLEKKEVDYREGEINLSSFHSNTGSTTSGIVYGNVSNASSIYFDDKILTPRGHGFAAEHANHLKDLYQGKNAEIVGDDNAKNGADRFVDGVNIQSKYCQSGSKCVAECFENGKFRYINPDGSPMQIEVPSDKYESAIQAMRNRIEHGEVPGVSNPAEAENIIRKGHFTYQQVKNIAKAGTVESICYDAASGAIIAKNAFGVTAVLTYVTAIWNGEDIDVAIKSAVAQGIKVGGTTFITSVLAGQLSKAGLNSALVGSSEAIVKILGPKASHVLLKAFSRGTNIYGAAAMSKAAKLLRGNMITGIVSFAVLSIGDVGDIFLGRISGEQLFKNLTNTASTIAGGTAGWVAGASVGASIGSVIPGFGTVIGGFLGGVLGSFAGGSAASSVSNAILDEFIEDDANKMIDIIQEVFATLAEEYLISKEEADRIVGQLENKLTGNLLKDMYESDNRKNFAREFLIEYFEDVANKRQYIKVPTSEQMQKGLKIFLEDIDDAS